MPYNLEILRRYHFYKCHKYGPSCNRLWGSQSPRVLRRKSAAARLLGLWVWIQSGAWMFVSCDCCVSSRGPCVEFITLLSLPDCGAAECDRETSIMRRRPSTSGCCALEKENNILWRPRVGVMVKLYTLFNFGTRWGGWSTPPPCRCTPGKENQHPYYIRLGGPWGPSGRVLKALPLQGLETRTIQPINTNNSCHCLVRLPSAIPLKVYKTFGNLPDVMHKLSIFVKI